MVSPSVIALGNQATIQLGRARGLVQSEAPDQFLDGRTFRDFLGLAVHNDSHSEGYGAWPPRSERR